MIRQGPALGVGSMRRRFGGGAGRRLGRRPGKWFGGGVGGRCDGRIGVKVGMTVLLIAWGVVGAVSPSNGFAQEARGRRSGKPARTGRVPNRTPGESDGRASSRTPIASEAPSDGAPESTREGASKSTDAATRAYFSANGLLNRGLNALAEAEYRSFLKAYPDHQEAPMARYGLAVSLYRQAKYVAAAGGLRGLAKVRGFRYAAQVGVMLGRCELALGDDAAAQRAFEAVLSGQGDGASADDAAEGLVEALYRQGRFDKVVEACARFESRRSESPLGERVAFFHGLALVGLRDDASAAKQLAAFRARYANSAFGPQARLIEAQCLHRLGKLDLAGRAYGDLLKRGAGSFTAEALLGLARIARAQGQPKQAGTYLDRLAKEARDRADTPDVWFERGRAWFDQERYDRAIEAFAHVRAEDEAWGDRAAYWGAKSRLRAGDAEAAADRLGKAIKRYPDSVYRAEMTYDRAIALVRAEQGRKGIEALTAFVKAFPEHALAPEALALAATLEHQAGRYDASAALCQRFIQQYATDARLARVAFLSAEDAFLQGQYESAAKAFTAFIKRFSDDPSVGQARYRLGMALYRLDRFDEAQAVLSQVALDKEASKLFASSLPALGQIAFDRGAWDEARTHYARYLDSGLDVAGADDALLKLGICLERLGRFEPAVSTFDRLLRRFKEGPASVQALFEKGQSLVSLERTDEARKAFARLLSAHGDSRFAPYALNHLGVMALRAGDPKRAAGYFGKVVEKTEDDALRGEALFQQGQALSAGGDDPGAVAVYAKYLDRYASGARAPQAAARRAIALSRLGRTDDALKAIAQTRKRFGSSLKPALVSALLYEQAWCLRNAGREDEARAAYQALLGTPVGDRDGANGATTSSADDGLRMRARLELAQSLGQAERDEDAVAVLDPLLAAAREDSNAVEAEVLAGAMYQAGISAYRLGRFDRSAKLLRSFIGRDDDEGRGVDDDVAAVRASACYFCGAALWHLERYSDAVRYFEQAVSNDSAKDVVGPALLKLGECQAALQRFGRSEQAFADYLDRFSDAPTVYQAHFGIGWARENQDRYQEAIPAYRQVTDHHQGPTAARAQFQIGECLFAMKNYADAVRAFLKVDILYAYPEWNAAALYEAGRCFEKLGRAADARAQLEKVVKTYGDTKWAALARKRLEGLPSETVAATGR